MQDYEGRWAYNFDLGKLLDQETDRALAARNASLFRITGFQSVVKKKVIVNFRVQSIYIPVQRKVAC